VQLLSRCGLRAVRFRASVAGFDRRPLLARPADLRARKVSEPKTKKSKAPVVVPVVLYKELVKLRECAEDGSDGAWVFRRVETAEYCHADRLPQLAQPNPEAGLERARDPSKPPNLRRTFATLAYNSGAISRTAAFMREEPHEMRATANMSRLPSTPSRHPPWARPRKRRGARIHAAPAAITAAPSSAAAGCAWRALDEFGARRFRDAPRGCLMVFDGSRDMFAVARNFVRFFAHESCCP